MKITKICCIGAGYVGGPTMAVIAKQNPNIKVTIYDPKVSEVKIQADLNFLNSRSEKENKANTENFQSPYEAAKNAHAIAIITEWEEFKKYDWNKMYAIMKKPAFIFDGRNLLNKKEMNTIGFEYYTIGQY